MLVKTISADAGGVGVLEDLLFAVNRIELRGYTGIVKRVVNDIPTDNIIVEFDRRIYTGAVRLKGIITIPPNKQEQNIHFFLSPNSSGARPWEIIITGEKSNGSNTVERINFDAVFTLPPSTLGLRSNGIIASIMERQSTVSRSNTRQQSQQQQIQTSQGRDLIL